MDGELYDEFGNYIGPELESDESDEGEEQGKDDIAVSSVTENQQIAILGNPDQNCWSETSVLSILTLPEQSGLSYNCESVVNPLQYGKSLNVIRGSLHGQLQVYNAKF